MPPVGVIRRSPRAERRDGVFVRRFLQLVRRRIVSTRVVHVNDEIEGAVYIGRKNNRRGLAASPFANPFPIGHDPDHTQRAGRDAQRVRRAAGPRNMATVSLLTDLKPGLFSWNWHRSLTREEASGPHRSQCLRRRSPPLRSDPLSHSPPGHQPHSRPRAPWRPAGYRTS